MLSRESRSWLSLMIGTVIFVVVCSSLYGGFKGYFSYKKSVSPDMEFNLDLLHFFTREYLERSYLDIFVDELPKQSKIKSFYLYADEVDLASLDSDLPSSGKIQTIPGHIKSDDSNFTSAMNFRYRGGLPMHWLYDKKSYRVRLPPFTTFRGERQFNLVNPSTLTTVTDFVSYEMAREIGLLTPEYFPARVYVNNENNGLHFFLSKVDESLLRKNKRMPGSIYSGDTVYVPNPFGAEEGGLNSMVFKKRGEPPLMWKDERLWTKDAARNSESKNDRNDIKKFISIINEKSAKDFMIDFEKYFDVEKQYLYWGLDTITGTFHHDNFHNHKLYFDPYRGKFEPIEWDLRYWTNSHISKDLPIYPLLKQVKLNPILEFNRDKIAFELLNKFTPGIVENKVDKANLLIEKELAADPFRQAPDNHWTRFYPDKVVPFSMSQYSNAIEELKVIYAGRNHLLNEIYASSKVSYTTVRESDDQLRITFAIEGNSPVVVNWSNFFSNRSYDELTIQKLIGDEVLSQEVSSSEMLYPGRRVYHGNILGRSDTWAVLAFGDEQIISSPLVYEFLVTAKQVGNFNPSVMTDVVNAITKKPTKAVKVSSLPDSNKTDSVHPWRLMGLTNTKSERVFLSGEITIEENITYEKYQTVEISAGTTIKLAPGKSMFFYGKVRAEGTVEAPITFKQKDIGLAWGSIVIQGQSATGTVLNNIHVSGGSLASNSLVNYPGQLNIHDVSSFSVSNCVIENNQIGDDAMHVAYSKGVISNCFFRNTAFDALDMDIVDVIVIDSSFENIGNDAIDLMNSKSTLKGLSISFSGDKCISVGEESTVKVLESQLSRCQIGIAVKDKSIADLNRVKFSGNRISGISLYRKNPRYAEGGTIKGSDLFGITENEIVVDSWSVNHILPSDLN